MIKIQEIPSEQRDAFRKNFPDAYFNDPLIDRVYSHRLRYFGLFNDAQLAGGFVVYEGGKGPLKTWITPPFYPHNGLFILEPSFNANKVLDALLAFAKHQYVCYVKWDLPLAYYSTSLDGIWKERWTYRLHLKQSEETLLKGVHATIKSSHQKALRNGCVFMEDTRKEEVVTMIKSNLDQKNVKFKDRLFAQIHTYYKDHPNAYYFSTFLGEQRIACNLIYIDNGVAYHLFSAFDRSLSLNYANAAHLMNTILHVRHNFDEVHTFDFEGSTVPAIDFYFKRFGGIQCKYPSLYYSRLPLFFKAN
jgi:hypothetical protein